MSHSVSFVSCPVVRYWIALRVIVSARYLRYRHEKACYLVSCYKVRGCMVLCSRLPYTLFAYPMHTVLSHLVFFQFFYWTISPVMSDCLLQISHGFYYVRVVPMVYYAILVTQSLQFVIVTFSVYHPSNYFSTFICRVTRSFKKSLSEI